MSPGPLARFLSTYEVTSGAVEPTDLSPFTPNVLLRAAGRLTIEGGLYRVHDSASSHAANRYVATAFPAFNNRIACFGFDWLGRQFATFTDRLDDEQAPVLMFEPGTGEALEIPAPFIKFHDEELVDEGDAALASRWHETWRSSLGRDMEFHECAGYEIPLFLGGGDTDENLAVVDIDVYWVLTSQLIHGTGALSAETPIGSVTNATPDERDTRGRFGRRKRG